MVDPLLETYYCKKCDEKTSYFVTREEETGLFWYEKKVGRKIHEDKVPTVDGSEGFTYSPDWDGDTTYWHKYERVYTYDYPDTVKCKHCKKKTEKRASIYYFSVGNGRNSYAALKERQRYAMDGMDKKQAETFYKEAIQASKERMETGNQHYKKIVPDYEVLRARGEVRKLNDQETANKIETLKRANQLITKDGTIGRGRKKR
jgi:hypothetical protein